jgi:N-acyl homoserine lactone hydrolase
MLGTLLFLSVALSACAQPKPKSTADVRLYPLECGEVRVLELDIFSDGGEYKGQQRDLAVSCYLIRHPQGDLLWDTGLPDSISQQSDGVTEGAFTISVPRTLASQLAELGVAPNDIEYLALSHSHFDHTGNANDYASSTWVSDPAERTWMYSEDAKTRGAEAETYSKLAQSRTIDVTEDLDLFGDGSVTLVRTPGHTPGHLVLMVSLSNSGPVLLSGDLYHMRESREHRRVPRFNVDRDQTLTSMEKFEALAKQTNARVIIQHDVNDIALLPKFPAYLD